MNSFAFDFTKNNLVQIFDSENIVLDIKYATKDNFMHKVLYPNANAHLHKDAHRLLLKATKRLAKHNKEHNTNYKLKIWDAFRPYNIQVELYKSVQGTPEAIYVSNPENGDAAHTRGIAIDLTIIDAHGKELDMGTEFDNFTEKAHRNAFEKKLITANQEQNRQLLNFVMGDKFVGYKEEWWHFNLPMTKENKVRYPKIKDL